MTPRIKDALKDIAATHGYTIKNTDRLDALSDKFDYQISKHGRMYCPCQPNVSADTICPCKFMREYKACKCGLYEVRR